MQLYLPKELGGQGWPVQKIANRYKMSRQRVEQIIAVEAKKDEIIQNGQEKQPEQHGNENQSTADSTVRAL